MDELLKALRNLVTEWHEADKVSTLEADLFDESIACYYQGAMNVVGQVAMIVKTFERKPE